MIKRTDKGEKYYRILDAAQKVFAENGFHSSKVSQIAKEAGIADGTIYLYFKNKDDILILLFEERMTMIIGMIEEAISATDDVAEKIRAFIKVHFKLIREQPDLMGIITLELRQSTKFMKDYKNEQFMRYLQLMGDILRNGKDAGLIRPNVSPGLMKRALFGMMDELGLFFILSDRPKYELEEAFRELSEFFIRGIWNHGSGAALPVDLWTSSGSSAT